MSMFSTQDVGTLSLNSCTLSYPAPDGSATSVSIAGAGGTTWSAYPATSAVSMASNNIVGAGAVSATSVTLSTLNIGTITVTSPAANVLDVGSAAGGQVKAASVAVGSMNVLNSGATGYYDGTGVVKSVVSLHGTGALAIGTAPLNTGAKVYGSMSAAGDLQVSGNAGLGIGTAAPEAKLDILTANTALGVRLRSPMGYNNTDGSPFLSIGGD